MNDNTQTVESAIKHHEQIKGWFEYISPYKLDINRMFSETMRLLTQKENNER